MSSPSDKENLVADPFAGDIFAAAVRKEEVETPTVVTETAAGKPNIWINRLPQTSRSEVNWDELWLNLPGDLFTDFPSHLADSLARILNLPDKKTVEFLFLVKREIDQSAKLPTENSNSWWLIVGVETSDAEIAFEIDNAFAVWLVDALLGVETMEGADLRSLTPSETTVLEFLSLNLAHEANRILGAPVFRFRSISPEIPTFLRRNAESGSASLVVVNHQIFHGLLPSIVKTYFSPNALRALQPGGNQSLSKRPFRQASQQNLPPQIKDVRVRVRLGGAELSFAETVGLEKGDVVILDNHDLFVGSSDISGRGEFFLGDDDNLKITGEMAAVIFSPGEAVDEKAAGEDSKILVRPMNFKSALQIRIENLTETKLTATTNGKLMTETDDNLSNETGAEVATDGQTGFAIENLAVTLRVELDARRLTLAEAGNLRENQVIELGIRPTDAVSLLIDNQLIGRGELVAIEGEERLGVRITKLLR